ncbi:GNAT family N-acetyltransferase [Sulfurospirillum sp. hDNRA2]|uniref:GNAT family N-acetyltransferase n=1 Tax=Sulfurospirillum sp. hDNRA2 TaxID=3237298 RepID=UPI0020B83985|nr:GNAT family N-acetyltransferase [Sulfurospirillum sp. DNRA8]MCP3651984.1 GNAT family N-acetyltransferase [Sulfurospirillum sp. DNRA8]MCR1810831.1 GNAT family N-acetyltransferase [Sulfurospirillum sp. DNRA8]
MLKIRQATIEDCDKLVTLLLQLFEQETEFIPNRSLHVKGLESILRDASIGVILVAENEKSIIAMVSLLWSISTALGAKVAWLEDMVVDNAFRSEGIGSVLIHEAIAYARSVGCRRITLLTDGDNIPARRFYEKYGFQASSMQPFRLLLSDVSC